MAINYADMTIDELEAASADITHRRDALSAEHKAVQAALDAKRVARDARAKLDAMPSAERAALEQLVRAQPAGTGEVMGTPGG